jgi:hypothetical protein
VAVSVASFRARWGTTFAAASDELIAEVLADAARQMNPLVWGAHFDPGIKQLAAHLLAVSPGGQFARLVSKDGATTFLTEFNRMRAQLLIGDRVI